MGKVNRSESFKFWDDSIGYHRFDPINDTLNISGISWYVVRRWIWLVHAGWIAMLAQFSKRPMIRSSRRSSLQTGVIPATQRQRQVGSSAKAAMETTRLFGEKIVKYGIVAWKSDNSRTAASAQTSLAQCWLISNRTVRLITKLPLDVWEKWEKVISYQSINYVLGRRLLCA